MIYPQPTATYIFVSSAGTNQALSNIPLALARWEEGIPSTDSQVRSCETTLPCTN